MFEVGVLFWSKVAARQNISCACGGVLSICFQSNAGCINSSVIRTCVQKTQLLCRGFFIPNDTIPHSTSIPVTGCLSKIEMCFRRLEPICVTTESDQRGFAWIALPTTWGLLASCRFMFFFYIFKFLLKTVFFVGIRTADSAFFRTDRI